MVDRDFYEHIKKGTTTVGIICSDGVAIGADSRATMDTFISSSEAVKVYRINDGLAMTIAGGVGDAEYLVKLLRMQDEIYTMEEKQNVVARTLGACLGGLECAAAGYGLLEIVAGRGDCDSCGPFGTILIGEMMVHDLWLALFG